MGVQGGLMLSPNPIPSQHHDDASGIELEKQAQHILRRK
jgi:hypothetical protein